MLSNYGAGEASPLEARKSNHPILKEINPKCSSEGLLLKLQILWSPDMNRLSGRDPDAGTD